MIRIVEGSLAEIQEEMKAFRKQSAVEARKIIRKYGGRQAHFGNIAAKDKELLDMNIKIQTSFTIGRTIPVYVGDKIINYKLAADFFKKLKGFQTHASVKEWGIEIDYWRLGRHSQARGFIQLYDLPDIFRGLKKIPKAEIEGLEL